MLLKSLEPGSPLFCGRAGQVQSQLEATPNGPVEQFCMVRGRHNHDVTRQCIYLQEQGTNYPLYLTCLMGIATLLAKSVKLIEEQYALMRSNKIEQPLQATTGLTEKAAYDGLVAHNKQRHHQFLRDGLGKRCLAISRRPREQYPMSWLQTV